MWISSMLIWTAMAGLVAMKLSLSSCPHINLWTISDPMLCICFCSFEDQAEENGAIQGIVKMEQEGDGDGTLQDRVDRIQLDLDGLVKTLNERCKKYGLRGKPTTLTELPFGWQPGIQGAAD
ncbi:hypothetical protein ACFX2I_035135 [Malus domestica]